jgi:hypothetical protein
MLTVTALTGWQATRGVVEFGASPANVPATPAPPGPHPAIPVGPGGVSTYPAVSNDLPAVPVRPGGLPTVAAVAPVRLAVPALPLNVLVKPVGVDRRTGELAVPEAVSSVGWYRYGPGLGTGAGSLVIAGHVDTMAEGAGPFILLEEIRPGTRINVRGADGSTYAFRVVSRESFRKSKAPYDRLFARDGPPRLTLVTCGGNFDPKTGSYRDNIVVTAVPLR